MANLNICPRPSSQSGVGARSNRSVAEAGSNIEQKDSKSDLPEWDLADLYPGMESDLISADLSRSQDQSAEFAARYKGKLEELLAGENGGAGLAQAIIEFEDLEERLGRLMSFAGLLYAGNTADPARAKFYGDLQDQITTISTQLLFFTLELNRIEDEALERALADEELARYRPWLEDLRRERPYQLADDIERLFHEKAVTGRAAWNRLFDETLTGLRFEVDGESLSLEPTLNLLTDVSRDKRRSAAQALSKTFADNVRTFTLITNTLAKDKSISDDWRGFNDVAAQRHLANRVEPEVVDALVEAVRESYPRLSHRYYGMKASWLGQDQLDYWDRNAPLPDSDTRYIPWQEAQETVLDAYGGFSPDMATIARRFFDNPWIDAPPREGKSPGAFAHPTVPSAHPYVLLNYQGKTRDVMTLAHELGHGVHQVLAAPQGLLMAQTPLTLAETASVFGEMLTFQSLLDKATDAKERKVLLAAKVEDMINTVVRQIAFYTFERRVHLERLEGELTSDKLAEIWIDVQAESLGPAIRLDESYGNYWAYIPHFIHAPFYVYAYAFGDCLVNSLFARYEAAEPGFQEKYFAMLKAGGTKHHKALLEPFGLDASDPDFWRMGLSVIDGFITDLEDVADA